MTSSARISAIAAFCKELREAREYQRITIREVSAMTRLGQDQLQAIEDGQWDAISRAYLRGYLGLYAQAVGMNVEKVLRGFDRLMLPESGSGAAVLDEAPPLLSEPQAVGVTRAKIRTTWFAVLSRNRGLLYTLSFLAVIGLFFLLFLMRKIEDRGAVAVLPFSEALAENRSALTTPFLIVPMDSAIGDAKHGQHWVEWIGRNRGVLTIKRDQDPPRRWHYDAYDTIKIQYVDKLVGRINPAASAMVREDSTEIEPEKILPGDTAVYQFPASHTVRRDSTESLRDSLVKS
jgi:hypothetical protein